MRKGAGFTLIEVLLVSALMAALSIAVFTCLANGLEMWKKACEANLEEDIVLFFDRMSGEVRNAFVFSTLPLDGQESFLQIPTIVDVPADRYSIHVSEGLMSQLGLVRYSFDAGAGEVTRQQAGYPDALAKRWGAPQVVLSGVTQVQFRYFVGNTREFSTHCDPKGGLPSEIQVVVRWGKPGDEKETVSLMTVPLGL